VGSELCIRDRLAAVRGFGAVTVDPRGFRSGALNEALDRSYR
jgi:PP-loop superfamily ATP-utilizing enzyme